jgi:SAM-dependent methyltransferase
VLDVACGRGRHALAAAALGAPTLALDRDAALLRCLSRRARAAGLPVQALRADVEAAGLPVRPASCGAVLVFRFLYRALCPALAAALKPGGLLLYETFTLHQKTLGYGPRNPDFLLRPGELRGLFPGLEILEAWEGLTEGPSPEHLARLAARRP